jgi:hypothetical protein
VPLVNPTRFSKVGFRELPGTAAPGQEETLGEAEYLAVQWPEFFTLPTFRSDASRTTARPEPTANGFLAVECRSKTDSVK